MKATLILALCLATNAFAAPKYRPEVSTIRDDHGYLADHPAPDYWALSGFYVPQVTGSACAVASSAMVINAMDANQRDSDAKNMSQAELFKLSSAMKSAGQKGIHSLDEFRDDLESVLKKRFADKKLTLTLMRFQSGSREENLKKLIEVLEANEKSARDFVIANFLQATLTGDPEGVGHVAPVGAYDAKKKRVLIFDPDRDYYEPYWVPVELFMDAMNTEDKGVKRSRGLVWVQAQ